MSNQSQTPLRQSWPARIMRFGGITNIVFSPIWAFLYVWLEPLEGRPVPADPFWLWSFYFCTTIFGVLYYRIGSAPERHASLIPVTVAAKTWGVFAISYAFVAGYGVAPLAGLYDLIFLPFFIALYLRVRVIAPFTEETTQVAQQQYAPADAPKAARR